uniref:Uncharacterized protein n=1 Tax=Oryza meridionalis TaxID=40149 RepID=A0A0E0DXD2_9ORYZ
MRLRESSAVQVSDLADPEPRCMSLEETKQLIGYMNTIVDSLLKIDRRLRLLAEIHEIIRDIREEGCPAVRRSLDQIRRDLDDADDGGGGGPTTRIAVPPALRKTSAAFGSNRTLLVFLWWGWELHPIHTKN